MRFDDFGGHFRFWAPGSSINQWFYKVFLLTFSQARKLRNATGIHTLGRVVIGHPFIVKTLCFFDDFGGHFRFWAQKASIDHWFYKHFRQQKTGNEKPSVGNAFSMFLKQLLRF